MRFLFVGLGGIGQRHLRNLRALTGDSTEIFAWRTRGDAHVLDDRLAIAVADGLEARYGVRRVASLEAGLDLRPDAVFVCNPSSLHLGVAQAAADAGCHLFIEKPLAASMDGIERLVATVREKKLASLVAYQLRFHPLVRRVKEMLEVGTIGRLLAARLEVAEYLPGWHPYEDYRRMYASRSELGGGVILSQIHEIDLVCWFFGVPRSVFALAGHWSSLDVDVEDVASTLMECESDSRPLPVHLHQDFIQRPPVRRIEIIGEGGRITLALDRQELHVNVPDAPQPDAERLTGFERNTLFMDEMRHFLACVRGEEVPMVPIDAGAQSLRVALAARESARSRNVVVP